MHAGRTSHPLMAGDPFLCSMHRAKGPLRPPCLHQSWSRSPAASHRPSPLSFTVSSSWAICGMRAMVVYVYQLVAPQLPPTNQAQNRSPSLQLAVTSRSLPPPPRIFHLIPSSVYTSVPSAYSAGAPVPSLLSHPAVPWAYPSGLRFRPASYLLLDYQQWQQSLQPTTTTQDFGKAGLTNTYTSPT